ncbi:hypothetical protein HMPREF1546_01039 [Oscillibacter sp. KLE 1745]|nr:hypothetical protein HMPREF1546_01039 [Oscillibacter sp. KLE 1745]
MPPQWGSPRPALGRNPSMKRIALGAHSKSRGEILLLESLLSG